MLFPSCKLLLLPVIEYLAEGAGQKQFLVAKRQSWEFWLLGWWMWFVLNLDRQQVEYLFLVLMNIIFLLKVARSVKGMCLDFSSSPLLDLSMGLVVSGRMVISPRWMLVMPLALWGLSWACSIFYYYFFSLCFWIQSSLWIIGWVSLNYCNFIAQSYIYRPKMVRAEQPAVDNNNQSCNCNITIVFKIMFDSSQKNRISLQAFVEEIQNWELTLTRQQKKLRSLRPKLVSKILRNEIEIIITEIEGELIRYRKLKDTNRVHHQNVDVIQDYNENSKRFMDIMETIGNFASKAEGEAEDFMQQPQSQADPQVTRSGHQRNYQDETFTYSISKQPKHKGDTNKLSFKTISKKSSTKGNDERRKNKTAMPTPNSTIGLKQKSQQLKVKTTNHHNLSMGMNSSNQVDSWEIRYQLKEIKSMMSQIQNEIKYHNHEDVEVELSKLQHNNKKMSLQMKALKEDSQYITSRIQKLKQQLATEKQIQSQMIQEFENPTRMGMSRKSKGKSLSHSVQNSRVRNNISHSGQDQEQLYGSTQDIGLGKSKDMRKWEWSGQFLLWIYIYNLNIQRGQ